MDKLRQYAANQKQHYSELSRTLESAKAAVAPDYEEARTHGEFAARLMLSLYDLHHGGPSKAANPDRLKLLDFGCGPGQVMEVFREIGVDQIDGCDISREMLKHAAANPTLGGSKFYLTNGADAGEAPADHYDIAYSLKCLHHIPMRETRIGILAALARTIANGGMIFGHFIIFPGITAEKIPVAHAHWTENMVARWSNSGHDVWITPDALGLVYDDFRLFFRDILFFESPTIVKGVSDDDLYHYNPDKVYNFGFNDLYVVGFKK